MVLAEGEDPKARLIKLSWMNEWCNSSTAKTIEIIVRKVYMFLQMNHFASNDLQYEFANQAHNTCTHSWDFQAFQEIFMQPKHITLAPLQPKNAR